MVASAPIARLRRLVDALPALGEDGQWLSDQLASYLAARGALPAAAALGVSVSPGGEPWWQSEARVRRDAAIRRLSQFMPGATVPEIGAALRRYATTRWRVDQALGAMPAAYAGTIRETLFEAFRAGNGRIPTGERQIRAILASGNEIPPIDCRREARISESIGDKPK